MPDPTNLERFAPENVEWPGEPTHPSYYTAPGPDSAWNVGMELGQGYLVMPAAAYEALYTEAQRLEAEREVWQGRAEKHLARIKDLEARLEKADALAEAVEEADAVYGNFERELTAYRESGQTNGSEGDNAR